MANDELLSQVMAAVKQKLGQAEASAPAGASIASTRAQDALASRPVCTEFVGINPLGDSIGLVIPNVDPQIHALMGIEPKYRSIGILGSRTGAGPQIFAADEAVKATSSEIVAIELPRDTKGGAGHGSLVIFGAEDVSDTRRAVEVALSELDRTFGDVYGNDAGHLEFQYTARASHALNKAFGAPVGKAFGITVGAPAAIGVVLADTAVKAATIDVIGFASPAKGTSLTNEVNSFFTGDSGAVRQAIIAAREVGRQLLGAMGAWPESTTTPYI
ncbi:MAG: propanediol utilization microcompartment protein PduB [Actinomycetia bacterium]|nr:propanediol utilization microcompartment protein PduB [Actinomycetes bacterium]